MKKNTILFLAVAMWSLTLSAQDSEYFGAGNDTGVIVTTSHNADNTPGQNTINGSGMDAALMETSRFLSQATFGSTIDEITRVTNMGFEAYLDEQFELEPNYLTDDIWTIWETILELNSEYFNVALANYIFELAESYDGSYYDSGSATTFFLDSIYDIQGNLIRVDTSTIALSDEDVEFFREIYAQDQFGPYALHFNYAWWDNMMKGNDQLRQRMAYALSQILVISMQSDLGDHAEALAAYYDIMQKHAFGNYRDLLLEVTLSPAMGYYLSHLNNPKAIPEYNVHPDENYAREIMQLFSIGLYMLNPDGSRMQDANGNDIPTYNNADIKELARVFTGLGPGELDPNMEIWWATEAYFGLDLYGMSKTDPLVMYEEWHDQGAKSLLNGLEIPANQGGMADIEMAVDFLFNHPNVGPFVCRQLIQRFVTSNPSPGYIQRVSNVFDNNGSGVRGDMKAVLRAILMDDEARSCDAILNPDHGKLTEPILRLTRMARAMPYVGLLSHFEVEVDNWSYDGIEYNQVYEVITDDLTHWNSGFEYIRQLRQFPLGAPTVFNFYLPDHSPVGEMADRGLVGPEYKIHDSSTSLNYINRLYEFANPWNNQDGSIQWYSYDGDKGVPYTAYTFEGYADMLANDTEALLNHFDILMTQGQMTDATRALIRTFMSESPNWVEPMNNTRAIIYFLLASAEYNVAK